MLDKFDATVKMLSKIGMIISAISIFIMMFYISAEVMSRFFLNRSIPGSYEFTMNYLMPLSVYTALAYTFNSGVFPRIDFLDSKINSEKIKKYLYIVVLIIELVAVSIIFYFGALYTLNNFFDNSTFLAGTSTYPIYPATALVVIGFLLLALQIISNIFSLLLSKNKSHLFEI